MFLMGVLALVAAVLTAIRSVYAASGSVTLASLRAGKYGFKYSHLPSPPIYEDEDGQADGQLVGKFTDRLPKTLALLFIIADLLVCAATVLGIGGLALGYLDLAARVRFVVSLLETQRALYLSRLKKKKISALGYSFLERSPVSLTC